jgi:hypothetical protein
MTFEATFNKKFLRMFHGVQGNGAGRKANNKINAMRFALCAVLLAPLTAGGKN